MAKCLVDFTDKKEFVYADVSVSEWVKFCEKSLDDSAAAVARDMPELAEKLAALNTPELAEKLAALNTPERKQNFVLEQALRDCAHGLLTRKELDEVRAIYGLEPYETDGEKARREHTAKSEAKRQLFWVEKPKPAGAKRQCPKCGGTGKFVLYFENGSPKSNTGFDCYKCGGRGWL